MKPVAAAALVAWLCAIVISHAAIVRAEGHVALQTVQATSTPLAPSPSDIEKMPLEEAVGAISAMTRDQAVHVFNEMSTGKVVAMMGKMDLAEVSGIGGRWSP
jgi:hypothetical protein